MLAQAVGKSTDVLMAARANNVIVPPPTNLAHLMRTARMGTNEKNSA